MKKLIQTIINLSFLLSPCLMLAQGAKPAPVNTPSMEELRRPDPSVKNKISPAMKQGVPLPAAITGYYREDFEGSFPPAGWQVVDVMDPTLIWTQSFVSPYTGLASAYMSFSAQTVLAEDWLIMPQFTATASDSITFFLKPEYVVFPPDTTFILVSTTDSATGSFTDVIATLIEGVSYPSSTIYQYYTFSLGAYAGQNIYVAFKNINIYGDGIFIDRVSIGTKTPNAIAQSIDLPKYVPIGTTSPQATIYNESDSVYTFPVTMTITGGYSSTKTITNMAPGTSVQVTFDPWTTSVSGSAIVNIQTQMPGDLMLQDDTLSAAVQYLESFPNFGWSSRAPMPSPGYGMGVAAINNNTNSMLYVAGGTHGGITTGDMFKYDPATDNWTTLTTMGNVSGTAHAFSNADKIYFMGGYSSPFTAINNTQIYNATTDSWSSGFALPSGVGDYAFATYRDSIMYFIGGYNGNDIGSVQIFNPYYNQWLPVSSIPAQAAGWRAGVSGNTIIVTGGYNQITGIKRATYIGTINPATPYSITWVTGIDYPAGDLTRPAGGGSPDPASGLVLFTGGDETGNGVEASNTTFAYDVINSKWLVGPAKPTPAHNLTNFAPVVYNDSLYMVAIGGAGIAGELDVNEWLNMGPYFMIIGITEGSILKSSLTAYPNPFTDYTSVKFTLGKSAVVKATIVDVLGNEVEVLCNKRIIAGQQQIDWNGANYPSGVYFCRLEADGVTVSQKIMKQ